MSMVIPFRQCIARPPGPNGEKYLLSEHLKAVALEMGESDGDRQSQLRFLSGLLHDAGKARLTWQGYINTPVEHRRKGTMHSPLGSALFAYCACSLLEGWASKGGERKKLRLLVLKLALDIYDHHGELSDLNPDQVPWECSLQLSHFDECDLLGLFNFVRSYFANIKVSIGEFPRWIEKFYSMWSKWVVNSQAFITRKISSSNAEYRAAARYCLRSTTAKLVKADRYHASGLDVVQLEKQEALNAQEKLKKFCHQRAQKMLAEGKVSKEMIALRRKIQKEAVNSYLHVPGEHFYTLTLPTGTGKTFSSLQIALTACAKGKCRRIIYVAPYLSILSQATKEIHDATGLEVLQHHHLSVIQQKGIAEIQQEGIAEQVDYLTLESWQAQIVTTTFNQLFRALFPRRAQHTIRLAGLDKAFLIIDEPQIINGTVWNLFLYLLEAAAAEYQMQVLFTTATLPILQMGLSNNICLAPEIEIQPRYSVIVESECIDQKKISQMVLKEIKLVSSVAVILNTIRDAAIVYQEISDSDNLPSNVKRYCLTGYMNSLHKAYLVSEIAERLEKNKPTIVVCTQLLEAGVDLSFRTLFRAMPIIPSIAQAAGRVNRHGEGNLSKIVVFNFYRDGKEDTRKYVYTDKTSRLVTDKCLTNYPVWDESFTTEIVEKYYHKVFERDTNTATLKHLVSAACGKWSALAGTDPFGHDYPQVSIFIPFGEEFLSPELKKIFKHFSIKKAEELYELYKDRKFLKKLNFIERKRFMALLGYFIVQVGEREAVGIAEGKNLPIARIVDSKIYSKKTGLAHLKNASDFSINCL